MHQFVFCKAAASRQTKNEAAMTQISLSQGKFAQISDDDLDLVAEFVWSARQAPSGIWYAVRREGNLYVYMHRLIMEINEPFGIPVGRFIDHVDGNGLNNQRSNLAVVSSTENTRRYHRRAHLHQMGSLEPE